jgi:hypothetical protein
MATYYYRDKHFDPVDPSDSIWPLIGFLVLAAVVGCMIGVLVSGSHEPKSQMLSDTQMLRATSGAKDFAGKAGMELLSCYGKDWTTDRSRTICTLRTYTGNYEYVACTYEQIGCIPMAYNKG